MKTASLAVTTLENKSIYTAWNLVALGDKSSLNITNLIHSGSRNQAVTVISFNSSDPTAGYIGSTSMTNANGATGLYKDNATPTTSKNTTNANSLTIGSVSLRTGNIYVGKDLIDTSSADNGSNSLNARLPGKNDGNYVVNMAGTLLSSTNTNSVTTLSTYAYTGNLKIGSGSGNAITTQASGGRVIVLFKGDSSQVGSVVQGACLQPP